MLRAEKTEKRKVALSRHILQTKRNKQNQIRERSTAVPREGITIEETGNREKQTETSNGFSCLRDSRMSLRRRGTEKRTEKAGLSSQKKSPEEKADGKGTSIKALSEI